jgi:uncharacterized membrane protein
MTSIEPARPREPVVSDATLALIVYILYFVGYFTGITAIIGRNDAMLNSHFQFQIRTFWIGLLYLLAGTILAIVLIGFFVLAWWFIWSLIRNVKGILALNENKPVPDPTSWLFG